MALNQEQKTANDTRQTTEQKDTRITEQSLFGPRTILLIFALIVAACLGMAVCWLVVMMVCWVQEETEEEAMAHSRHKRKSRRSISWSLRRHKRKKYDKSEKLEKSSSKRHQSTEEAEIPKSIDSAPFMRITTTASADIPIKRVGSEKIFTPSNITVKASPKSRKVKAIDTKKSLVLRVNKSFK